MFKLLKLWESFKIQFIFVNYGVQVMIDGYHLNVKQQEMPK